MQPIISFNKVAKIYSDPYELALQDVSFEIYEGEFICLVGGSGSGKSTILEIIAGLEAETAGTVVKPEQISMSFQSGALFPWLTVFENVAFGLNALENPRKSERHIKIETDRYIELMKLGDFIDKYPRELSGGQRQRVGIARALAVSPKVLLLDEPFSALDPKTTAELHDDILRIWRDTKKTIVMVSHIIEEAVSLAKRVFLVKDKTIHTVFPIQLSYPRRDQENGFMHDVTKIRKQFFEN